MSERVTVWKIEHEAFPGNWLAVDASGLDALFETISTADVEDSFRITVEEWDRDKLAALPAWDGW